VLHVTILASEKSTVVSSNQKQKRNFKHTTEASVTTTHIANIESSNIGLRFYYLGCLGASWFGRRLLITLWSKGLGGAVIHNTILDQPFQKPVVVARAGYAGINAGKAQVVVSIVANAAVVVVGRDDFSTVVAIYTERAICVIIVGKAKGICGLFRDTGRQGQRNVRARGRDGLD
jgi:hypothetical protein